MECPCAQGKLRVLCRSQLRQPRGDGQQAKLHCRQAHMNVQSSLLGAITGAYTGQT